MMRKMDGKNMEKNIIKKCLIFGIIMLFVGTSIITYTIGESNPSNVDIGLMVY